MSIHPLRKSNRPIIATRPIEALADAIKIAIEDGHQGIQVYGRSRDGKTMASSYLQSHDSWLDEPAAVLRISMVRRENLSDSAFYIIIQMALGLLQHPRSSAALRIRQISDKIIADCLSRRCTRAILFIDEAQHLSDNDFEYLTNIDNTLTESGYQLFCVFISQTDDTKAEKRRKRSRLMLELPPHVVGRYFMAEHAFSGLRGNADIAHALDQFDSRLFFEGASFTEFFAKEAFASGWRIAHHANDFVNAIASIRRRNHLPIAHDLAMKIFDVACYRLLVRIAGEATSFGGFDQEIIEKVLIDSGYICLEVARQRQVAA